MEPLHPLAQWSKTTALDLVLFILITGSHSDRPPRPLPCGEKYRADLVMAQTTLSSSPSAAGPTLRLVEMGFAHQSYHHDTGRMMACDSTSWPELLESLFEHAVRKC
jgi:hypothetical protein